MMRLLRPPPASINSLWLPATSPILPIPAFQYLIRGIFRIILSTADAVYREKWCARRDLNPQPFDSKSNILAGYCHVFIVTLVIRRVSFSFMKTLLIIADSPTLETGFGRVCQNLLNSWLKAGVFDSIEVWGIGYTGWPHSLPVKIYPAQSYEASNWCNPVNLVRLARLIKAKKYSHLWVMQDLFLLSSKACMETLGDVVHRGIGEWGLECTCYCPVDAPVEPWWCNFLVLASRVVTYTQYGWDEICTFQNGMSSVQVDVIPHGTDTDVYRPIEMEGMDRVAVKGFLRKQLLVGYEWSDDFLIINVNQNQRRKGLLQTLQTFAWLKGQMPNRQIKLYMHMRSVNEAEGIDLKVIARELDLGADVMFGDAAFAGGKALISESGLNRLYNAADLLLTTTHGEGWGLSITEAMAAGCPVAGPNHTSLTEIMGGEWPRDDESTNKSTRGIVFNTLGHVSLTNDNNRLRPVTDVIDAGLMISEGIPMPNLPYGDGLLAGNVSRALEWIRRPEFRWDAIAARFYEK